jgi:hypothetical protein
MMKRAFLLLLLGLWLLPMSVHSQTQGVLSKKWYGNWSIGISGGPNIFFGDLKVHRFFPATTNENEVRFAGSFYLIRQLSHVFALRGQVLYGELSGTKRVYKSGAPCNQYFVGNILDYSINTTINFSNLLFRYKPKRIFFIYGTLGVGMSNWITKKKDLNTHQQIGGSGSAKNWTTEWMIPAGLGAYFNIRDKVNLGVEWTLRGVNSDKLDATVGGFPYDMYSYLSLNLVYNFNKRNEIDLESAHPTMPPVTFPKPKYESSPSTSVSQDSLGAGTGQPLRGSTDTLEMILMEAMDSIYGRDTIADTTVVEETTIITEEPYQHPGVEPDIFYRVQIMASSTGKQTPLFVQRYFRLSMLVIKERSEGYYRYYVGEFEQEAEANQLATALHRKPGLKHAFVVKYINGRRELTNPQKP